MPSTLHAAIAAAAAFALTALGTAPVAAAKKPKPVVVSASAFKDDTSRLCMPTPGQRDAKTECHTRSEWEAMGVTFEVK